MAPKKKKTKAEKLEEKERLQRELEERLERERLEEERQKEITLRDKERRKREETELAEKEARDDVLKEICDKFQSFQDEFFKSKIEDRKEEEWKRYVSCERLPYPDNIPNMNTYLYFWHDERHNELLPLMKQYELVINILDYLDKYIEEPLDADVNKIKLWKEVKERYRQEIRYQIDYGTFTAIRNMVKYLTTIDSWECQFEYSSLRDYLWLWTWLTNPKRSTDQRPAPGKGTKNIRFQFPLSFRRKALFLRVWITEYDDKSDTSSSWTEPSNPISNNIYEENLKWHERKLDIIKKNYEILKKKKELPFWYESIINKVSENLEEELEEESENLTENAEEKVSEGTETIDVEKSSEEERNIEEEEIEEEILESKRDTITDLTHTPIIYDLIDETPNQEDEQLINHGVPNNFYREICNEELRQMRYVSHDDREDSGFVTKKAVIQQKFSINDEVEEDPNAKVQLASERAFLDWVSDGELFSESDLEMKVEDYILNHVFGCSHVFHNNVYFEEEIDEKPVRNLEALLEEVTARNSLPSFPMDPVMKASLAELLGRRFNDTFEETKGSVPDIVMKPSERLSEVLEEVITDEYERYKRHLFTKVREDEINLRAFHIIGGLYHLDLIEHVSQPFETPVGDFVQLHFGEYKIKKYNYSVTYIPKVEIILDAEETKENLRKKRLMSIRESVKNLSFMTQKTSAALAGFLDKTESLIDQSDVAKKKEGSSTESEDENEDKTIIITIQLPKNCIWFEDPKPVQWNEKDSYWSEKGIYEVHPKEIENGKEILFKITKIGIFGLAVFKYINLPFKSWSLSPISSTKSVLFSLICSNIGKVNFLFEGSEVCLQEVENVTDVALEPLLNVFYSPKDLIKKMRNIGMDLFPGWDGFHYIRRVFPKNKILEEHIYKNMALSCLFYEFEYSKWNIDEEMNIIILQYKLMTKNNEEIPFSTAYCDMYRTFTINCSEKDKEFSKERSDPDNAYHPDLFNLLHYNLNENMRKNMDKGNNKYQGLILAVFKLLMETKVLSFS